MEELKNGCSDVRLLARFPAVWRLQQLGGVQPLLQVLNQLLACSTTGT